ncbi:MAG: hypothetical protein ACFE85_09240 [Candidatus Hodarchaeota archaeon]
MHYPNDHPAHFNCLKDWLIPSSKCSVCNEPYPQGTLEKFKSYIDKKEKRKKKSLKSY